MKKKLLAVLLATAMVFSLTACGSGDTETKEPAEDVGAENEEEDEKSAADLKIGLVTDVGGVEDQSFNQSAWEGLQRAAKDLGVEVNLSLIHI